MQPSCLWKWTHLALGRQTQVRVFISTPQSQTHAFLSHLLLKSFSLLLFPILPSLHSSCTVYFIYFSLPAALGHSTNEPTGQSNKGESPHFPKSYFYQPPFHGVIRNKELMCSAMCFGGRPRSSTLLARAVGADGPIGQRNLCALGKLDLAFRSPTPAGRRRGGGRERICMGLLLN